MNMRFDRFLGDEEYETRYETELLPYMLARRTDSMFSGCDGNPLHLTVYPAEEPTVGSVIILHGFTESAEKYTELAYYFVKNGLRVYAYDQRGHGTSYRAVKKLTYTHADRFEDYVDDLAILASRVKAENPALPCYLYSHSMGGGVSAMYLERTDAQVHIDRAVLSSPMIELSTDGVPFPMAKVICRTLRFFGLDKKRVFVCRDYPGHEEFASSSSDFEPRFETYQKLKRAEPHLQNYCPTYGWLLEAVLVTKKLLAEGKPEGIRTPILLFSAEHDRSVHNPAQKTFAERVPDCTFCFVPGTRHEIYHAAEKTVFPYFEKILTFFLDGET